MIMIITVHNDNYTTTTTTNNNNHNDTNDNHDNTRNKAHPSGPGRLPNSPGQRVNNNCYLSLTVNNSNTNHC